MPIYEYVCEACGHEFEKLVKVNAALPDCPECQEGVRKKVSASGFILKGGGWYKDHYGLKSSSASKGESTSSGSDSGSSSSSSTSDSSASSSSSSSE